ncbi:hypothetical protein [Ruegeria sp. YS9]|uniref:hypothetical protein n=1 Tax=Ruegeria sp. YS9 TaxID=2966453 RepID=UPI00214C3A9A|nr:hypothetical protein [Ruegeria sp. YS9]UUV08759.1 hypothetical protein NOR97_21040 [Ruegeria sp. YS9]
MITAGALLKSDNFKDDIRLSHLLKDSHGRILGLTTRWVLGDDPSPTTIWHEGKKIGHASPRYQRLKEVEERCFQSDILVSTFEVLPVEEIGRDFSTNQDAFPALGVSECLGQDAYIDGAPVGKILHHYDRFFFDVGKEQIEVSQILRLSRSEADLASPPRTTRNGAMIFDKNGNMIGVVCAAEKPFYWIVPVMTILTRMRLQFLQPQDVRSFNDAIPGHLAKVRDAFTAGAQKLMSSAKSPLRSHAKEPRRRASQFEALLEEEA